MAHPEKDDQELDEDGLVVQQYDSTVLVVLPAEGFGEQLDNTRIKLQLAEGEDDAGDDQHVADQG